MPDRKQQTKRGVEMSLSRPEVSVPPLADPVDPTVATTVATTDASAAGPRRIRHQARDAAASAAVSLGGSVAVTLIAWAVLTWLR